LEGKKIEGSSNKTFFHRKGAKTRRKKHTVRRGGSQISQIPHLREANISAKGGHLCLIEIFLSPLRRGDAKVSKHLRQRRILSSPKANISAKGGHLSQKWQKMKP
jgi:hypothetical protein